MGNVDHLSKAHLGRSRSPDSRNTSLRPLFTRYARSRDCREMHCAAEILMSLGRALDTHGGRRPEPPATGVTPPPPDTPPGSIKFLVFLNHSKFHRNRAVCCGIGSRAARPPYFQTAARQRRSSRREPRPADPILRATATTPQADKRSLPAIFSTRQPIWQLI